MNRVAKSSQPSRVSRWSAVGTITGERRPNVRQNDGGPPRLTQKSDTCQVNACVVRLRCRQIEEGTMTVREFLTNIAILSAIMAIAALIEAAVPMFSRAP